MLKYQISLNYSNIKFQENLSAGSRVCPLRQTDLHDMTKLIVAFRNFGNLPEVGVSSHTSLLTKTSTHSLSVCLTKETNDATE